MKLKRLQPEEGTTEVSLQNAKILIRQYGQPATLDFCANRRKCEYFVIATWPNGYKFTFTGFAWGYGGTGPSGLVRFLLMIDCPVVVNRIPLDKYGRTNATWDPRIFDRLISSPVPGKVR